MGTQMVIVRCLQANWLLGVHAELALAMQCSSAACRLASH